MLGMEHQGAYGKGSEFKAHEGSRRVIERQLAPGLRRAGTQINQLAL